MRYDYSNSLPVPVPENTEEEWALLLAETESDLLHQRITAATTESEVKAAVARHGELFRATLHSA